MFRDAACSTQREGTKLQPSPLSNTFTTVLTAGEWFKRDWITTANQFRFGASNGPSTGTARVSSWDYGGLEASPTAAITVPITSGMSWVAHSSPAHPSMSPQRMSMPWMITRKAPESPIWEVPARIRHGRVATLKLAGLSLSEAIFKSIRWAREQRDDFGTPLCGRHCYRRRYKYLPQR